MSGTSGPPEGPCFTYFLITANLLSIFSNLEWEMHFIKLFQESLPVMEQGIIFPYKETNFRASYGTVPLLTIAHKYLSRRLDILADVLAEVFLHGGQQRVGSLHVHGDAGDLVVELSYIIN